MVHILLFESHFPGKSGFQANHCVCRVGIKRKSCSIFLTVSGCTDSAPLLSTSDCSAGGDITLTIHGVDFMSEDQVRITEGCLSAYLSVSVQKKKIYLALLSHTRTHTHLHFFSLSTLTPTPFHTARSAVLQHADRKRTLTVCWHSDVVLQKPVSVTVKVGEQICTTPMVLDSWTITCVLAAGTGEELGVNLVIKIQTSSK